MLSVRRSDAGSLASTFPFRVLREFRKGSSHYARPSWRCALSPAACIRSGFPDRSRCTACTSAIQNRISDIAPRPNSPLLEVQPHIAHNAKLRVCPADSLGADPKRGPNAADHSCVPGEPCASPVDAIVDHCPGNQVDGIWPQKTSPSVWPHCVPDQPRAASAVKPGHGSTRITRINQNIDSQSV